MIEVSSMTPELDMGVFLCAIVDAGDFVTLWFPLPEATGTNAGEESLKNSSIVISSSENGIPSGFEAG
jgi:hypothetical protein